VLTVAALGVALAPFVPTTAVAQGMSFDALRDAAVEAMGGRAVHRVEFTGNGWDACVGQAWDVNAGWARWEIRDYRRVIDYDAVQSVQTAQRRAGLDPGRIGGCGAQPDAPATTQRSSTDGESSFADQLPIWLTPQGFLDLAAKTTPKVERDGAEWEVTLEVPSDEGVVHTVHGYYGDDFRLRRIQTWVDDSVFGDMEVLAELGAYRKFGAIEFPASVVYKEGGFTTLSLTIDNVVPDTQASAVPESPPRRRPAAGAAAAPGPAYAKIGEGIFVLPGSYQSVAVEFDDFAVVIDGLQNDARAAEIIRLTHQAIPGKPIRYVVSTHSHFDHASGLRLFAAEGAVILTQRRNVAFFQHALDTPRTLNGSRAAARNRAELSDREAQVSVKAGDRVLGVGDRFVIRDGSGQAVELYKLEGSVHADDMLIAYLPSIKTIVEADVFQPWINPVFGGGREGPHPFLVYLDRELKRLGLDYEQFVPVHAPNPPLVMPKSALVEAVN
jgi:glyoxylase-like metal-dependent hydrolase (beta-lactamase superfamily II)